MASLTPQMVYNNLQQIDSVGVAKSATYRQQAQDILADPNISLQWRQAIAERLNQANHLLGLLTVKGDDSY